ncbi:MAG TPA: hypothetical protein VHY32_04870 [Caulobacteraceae bacterium]|nr:hypothetical protein [Caulobacteraceae bacterium]
MDYRLYFLDRAGRIQRFEAYSRDTDEAAVLLTKAKICDQPIELWQQDRFIAKFPSLHEVLPRKPLADERARPGSGRCESDRSAV